VTDRTATRSARSALFRDNTPNGATVDTNHQIADWEAISLAPTSRSTTSCPADGS
jgi:hypothetical protein